MKVGIDCHDRREGELIRVALADPEVRAFVKVMGVLLPLSSDRARARVLSYVTDQMDEEGRLHAEEG
jgi:hypothetical protein